MITEAIILAGGLGTRLRSVVADVPKCMAPVNGIPFINFVISWLKNEGVNRFILSLGYKSEIVIEHIKKEFADIDIDFVIEESPLGTGGAIKLACSKVKSTHVLILNGDTLFNIDIKKFSVFHKEQNADFSVALKHMKNFSRYGSVEFNKDFSLKAFNEKKFCTEGFINGGVYALNVKSFIDTPLPDIFSFEKDYLEKYIADKKFYGLPCDYYFIDIGIPEDYKRFSEDYNLILSKSKHIKTNTSGSFIGDLFFEGLIELLD